MKTKLFLLLVGLAVLNASLSCSRMYTRPDGHNASSKCGYNPPN